MELGHEEGQVGIDATEHTGAERRSQISSDGVGACSWCLGKTQAWAEQPEVTVLDLELAASSCPCGGSLQGHRCTSPFPAFPETVTYLWWRTCRWLLRTASPPTVLVK